MIRILGVAAGVLYLLSAASPFLYGLYTYSVVIALHAIRDVTSAAFLFAFCGALGQGRGKLKALGYIAALGALVAGGWAMFSAFAGGGAYVFEMIVSAVSRLALASFFILLASKLRGSTAILGIAAGAAVAASVIILRVPGLGVLRDLLNLLPSVAGGLVGLFLIWLSVRIKR